MDNVSNTNTLLKVNRFRLLAIACILTENESNKCSKISSTSQKTFNGLEKSREAIVWKLPSCDAFNQKMSNIRPL